MNRTITTAEELDALPTGSVVLSRNYPNGSDSDTQAAFQKRGDGNWYRGARASWVHPDGFLPATILHPRPLPDREQIARAMEQVLIESVGECTCDEAYTTRKLNDPDCLWHNANPRGEFPRDAADAVLELFR